MTLQAYPVSKALTTGATGGIVGALVQGILGSLLTQSVGQEMFFVTIARNLGMGDSSVVGGWVLHILTGLIVGATFVGLTVQVGVFRLGTTVKAVWMGALAGVAVWVILLLPTTTLFLPADLGAPAFLVGSFTLHLLYGTVTVFTAYSLLRRGTQKAVTA